VTKARIAREATSIWFAPMRLRSSGIIVRKNAREVSGHARRKSRVFALADLRLDLGPDALSARHNRTEGASGDRGHRSILLLRWQIPHELAMRFF
jgi:hypothetical protein